MASRHRTGLPNRALSMTFNRSISSRIRVLPSPPTRLIPIPVAGDQPEPLLSCLRAKDAEHDIRIECLRFRRQLPHCEELDILEKADDEQVSHIVGRLLKNRFYLGEQIEEAPKLTGRDSVNNPFRENSDMDVLALVVVPVEMLSPYVLKIRASGHEAMHGIGFCNHLHSLNAIASVGATSESARTSWQGVGDPGRPEANLTAMLISLGL